MRLSLNFCISISCTLIVFLLMFTHSFAQEARYGNAELIATSLDGKGIVTEIAFFTPEIVNIRHYVQDCNIAKQNLVVTLEKQDVTVNTEDMGTEIRLTSDALCVSYNKSSGCVMFISTKGDTLLTERSSASLTSTQDGRFESYTVKQSFSISLDEKIYGFGQLQNGCLNQRGQTYSYMIEGNTSVWIPYFYSSKGYSLFWDNASPTTFKDNGRSVISLESAVGYGIDYFLLASSSNKISWEDGVSLMRELTGDVPMLPLWTYGYFQSKERYESAEETMSVAKRYRELGVPLDCVVQDWQYWGDNNMWNALEFSNPKFSNYQTMIDSLHAMHSRIMVSVWANFGPDTKPYAYFKEHDELIMQGDKIMTATYPPDCNVAIYDPYNEDARQAYWDYFFNNMVSHGIDAYWMDSSEPDHSQGGTDMEETFDFVTGLGCTWRSVRNAFPLIHVGGVYDCHRAEPSLNRKRVTIMTRSAYAGQQRYGANTWSGDVTASWETFKNQIPAALNFTICGNPNWNSDTGAFFNGELQGPGNDEYDEFYARWLQFSAFCPMMRSHGSGTDKAIYVWGNSGMQYYDNIEKYINLRYAILPYIYSTAWEVHSLRKSFMNAVGLSFNEDENAINVKDEYLFGNSFLVAPVMEYQAENRQVYLPKNNSTSVKWIDFWTGEVHEGGQTISKNVTLDVLPLYVKAGSILPFAKPSQYCDITNWDTLQIRIYPNANGSFVLYEDEGDSYDYEQGLYSTISFYWNDATKHLSIGDRQGSFDKMLQNRVFDIVLVSTKAGKGDSVSTQINKRIEYDGSAIEVEIEEDNIFSVEYISTNKDEKNAGKHCDTIYNVNGTKLSQIEKGINIMKLSDGNTHKIAVR